jgi:frataxin-like iron-binding protein CyaY
MFFHNNRYPKANGTSRRALQSTLAYLFNKTENKWQANIYIGGKQRSIGYYENEEEAAVDYARALFKYKGQDGQDKARGQNSSVRAIDLRDVPPQQPILKSKRRMKEGVSKYVGVYPNQANNKWTAIITIDSKPRYIGSYKNEEEAAIDFARAVFKYRGQRNFEDIMKKRQRTDGFEIDLADVPPQKPIPKSKGRMKEGASKYAGVSFDKSRKKWKAQITIEGKVRLISNYVNEEEAAVDYARAVFKYQGQGMLDKKRKLNSSRPGIVIDLTDVPPKLPILKSVGRTKEGASKYIGVHFDKRTNKWKTQLMINGEKRYIGCYENEEEAAIVYARAVFKYKGQEALNNLKERNLSAPSIDLSDVPPQLPILKRADQVKKGASKYAGVYFHKANSKWLARIELGGKSYYIGSYENEEEAAADHARAVFKYKNHELPTSST